jgi:hypothetical protein
MFGSTHRQPWDDLPYRRTYIDANDRGLGDQRKAQPAEQYQ